MALELTHPTMIARAASAQSLLIKALRTPVQAPQLDETGALAMTPLHPMRGRAADPAPAAVIRFPQAESGHQIALEAARTKGIIFDSPAPAPALAPVMVAARPTLAPEQSMKPAKEALPAARPIALRPGYMTEAMDRRKFGSWGR